MTSPDILTLYEQLAGLTAEMAAAARAGDWDRLSELEDACRARTSAMQGGVPALTGELRARKATLLKQIMANDRAIRDVTEPWQAQLARIATATAPAPAQEVAAAH